jgi:hypothetical protein
MDARCGRSTARIAMAGSDVEDGWRGFIDAAIENLVCRGLPRGQAVARRSVNMKPRQVAGALSGHGARCDRGTNVRPWLLGDPSLGQMRAVLT